MESASGAWPASVPRTLWQFGLLVPESRRAFPFVGIAVSWEFVAAFLAGTALICVFAWKRFSEPTYDVNADAFRDFKGLSIWNLKDSVSLRRAYVIYCISLIFIYATLTFFGKVIAEIVSDLNVSGLQISVGTIAFDSWQWPLFLALGIAGFAPLINPLVPAESWLRRFSHEVVGIPTRLREKAVRLKTLIDGSPDFAREPITSDWVKAVVGPKLRACFALKENLQVVVKWSYKEHVEWSDPEIRRKLNEYERGVRDNTEAALADFEYLTEHVPDSELSKPDRRKEFEKKLSDNILQLEDLRDRFSLIMAIYAEYGSRFDQLEGASRLRENIASRFVDRNELPGTGLPLYAFSIVFIVYWFAVSWQWHPPISAVPLSPEAITTTAALETLKVFLLVWLPTTAVATFTSVMFGSAARDGSARESVFWATIPGAIAALGVAALAMAAFAILYVALPASNIAQMQQSLFGGGVLQYFLLLAPVAVFCFIFVNAVRAPERRPSAGTILVIALAAAALTLVYLGNLLEWTSECHRGKDVSVWLVMRSLVGSADALSRTDLKICFPFYGTLDLIIIPASVFLSVAGLTRLGPNKRRFPRLRFRKRKATIAETGATTALLAVVCAIDLLAATAPSLARDASVVLGFRDDIQPFSYLAPGGAGSEQRPYLGYVADLCYEIFDKSGYVVEQVAVTAEDRFQAMRRNSDLWYAGGKRVDVLCDATTVRIDDPQRMEAGVFSPIIFVSGVSYLWRSERSFENVELGYIGNSTSVRVAKEACSVDVLRLGPVGKLADCLKADPKKDCLSGTEDLPARASDASSRSKKAEPKDTKSLGDIASSPPPYVLCPKSSHDELIKWFCSRNGHDKLYFGDRDIILAKLDSWKKTGHYCNDVRDPAQSYTYEPYALLVSRADPELVSFVQRRVYELFSHRDGVEALFRKWFPGQTMSEPLAWLFVLNGVMDQDESLSGRREFYGIEQPHEPPAPP